MRSKAFKRHLLSSKTTKRKRQLTKASDDCPGRRRDGCRLMLPYK